MAGVPAGLALAGSVLSSPSPPAGAGPCTGMAPLLPTSRLTAALAWPQDPPGPPESSRLTGTNLLKPWWTSQQRLQSSNTPDSTTRVPPTKSDITTTTSM